MGHTQRSSQERRDVARWKRASVVVMVAAVCWVAPGAARANMLGIDGFTAPLVSTENSTNRTLGWSFSVDTTIVIKELGVWDANSNGLGQAHQVGLWTAAGSFLGSTLVQAGTATPAQGPVIDGGVFRFAPVTDIVLDAGQSYVIGAFFNGDDEFIYDAASMSTAGEITFGATMFSALNSGFAFPDLGLPAGFNRLGLAGPNFTFVPEPSTAVLLSLGLVGLATRRRRR